MPTVPNLAAAVDPTAADLLWLTQGMGVGRNRKATLSQASIGGIPGALQAVSKFEDVNGTAGPTRVPVLGSLDGTLQSDLKYMEIGDLVASRMTQVVLNAPEITRIRLLGDPVLCGVDNTYATAELSDLWQVAEIPKAFVTLRNYNNGTDSYLNTEDVGGSFVRIGADPLHRAHFLDIALNLSAMSASATNSNVAQIDISGVSLGDEWDGWAVGGIRFFPIVWTNGNAPIEVGGGDATIFGYVATAPVTSGKDLTIFLRNPAATTNGDKWRSIAPTNNKGIHYLAVRIPFNKGPA